MKDPYELLEVDRNVSDSELKRKFLVQNDWEKSAV